MRKAECGIVKAETGVLRFSFRIQHSQFSIPHSADWAIVPAAGLGRRIGLPKQTLPYRGETLAGNVTRTLLRAGVDGLVVVTRTRLVSTLGLPDDPRVKIAFNDREDSEMIDSIRIGLAALAGQQVAGVIVVPADMPTLSVDTCRKCMAAYAADPQRIVIATLSAHRGHPIIFPFSLRAAVDQLDGGLNQLPRQYPERVHLLQVDDPGVTRDVDALADYDALM